MSLFLRLIGSANPGEVEAAGQQRAILYDFAGNLITPAHRGTIGALAGGLLAAGADYKLGRAIRSDEAGTLRTSDESPLLNDASEGAAVDTNKWIQTTTTMTISQAAATGVLLNAGSSTSATVGAMHTSHRRFPMWLGGTILARFRARPTAHFNNNLHEIGFGTPASATAATSGDGAFWRKDASGQWLPVISFGGNETLGTPISNATFVAAIPTTDYAIFTVILGRFFARFEIRKQDGTLVHSQDMEWASFSANAGFAVTHVQGMYRTYNSAGPGTAVQLLVKDASFTLLDVGPGRPWNVAMSGMNYNSLTSPTAYTQNANWGNSAAPTTRTLSNTAAAETTLGGLLRVNSIGGGNTDYIMFGWTNPSPFTFYCDGIWIPAPLNEVVTVATTATIFAYFASFNLSAVSLATGGTYPGHRIALPGIHTAAVGVLANNLFSGSQVFVQFPTPFAVQPGRFLHIGCRELVGTATATETYLWGGVGVSGFFE
jgi:hypothetical protein